MKTMTICKKCGSEFQPQKGLISYCSLECRNSRSWSESDKLKKSISAKKSNKVKEANKNIGKLITKNYIDSNLKIQEDNYYYSHLIFFTNP